LKTIRGFINLLFLGVWTAFMVSAAVTASALRGDASVFRRAQRVWAAGLLRFWGVRLNVHGAELVDTQHSYVVISNHLSYADIVVLFLALPIIPGFLAKRELTRVPFLAAALRTGGHVIIDRERKSSAHETITRAADEVRAGKTVLIFPEGTRGDCDTVGPFKKGGFHLAKAAGVPILPVGVRGSRAIFARSSWLIRPGQVTVHLGAPIPPAEVEQRSLDELTQLTRARVMELSAMPDRRAAPGSRAAASGPAAAR
jgi:1-acyl-sn-glycerol-3-phosphate acyltransferase